MSEFYEIAYALAAKRLCLFTGTGFSKAVTNNKAPSWEDLLKACCEELSNAEIVKNNLFPDDGSNDLSLEDKAQIIQIELQREEIDLHDTIKRIIDGIDLAGDNSTLIDFFNAYPIQAITTNYDKLLEKLFTDKSCHSIAPGLSIPRSTSHAKVYHIHGSVDFPKKMIVTSEDYFKFINSETYFSRKLSTSLRENTVVIMGYSLSDTNLKAIINDYKLFSNKNFSGGNIFLISRGATEQHIKDYSATCYGIRVIDNTEVDQFFIDVNACMDDATQGYEEAINRIKLALQGHNAYDDIYLKKRKSIYEIISSISAIGHTVNDPEIVTILTQIIEQKRTLTKENGAWEQYHQMAQWLVYIASKIDLDIADIREPYLEATFHSMDYMSRSRRTRGSSWDAYSSWNNGWSDTLPINRRIIKDYIEGKEINKDALELVARL